MKKVAAQTATNNGSSTKSIVQNTNFVNPFVIGLNSQVINKDKNHKGLNSGFKTHTVNLEQLATHVKDGHAIAGTFNGWRNKINYEGTQTLYLDYDGGASIVEALADSFINQYAALVYTSASHGKEGKDRFRVVFVCPDFLPKDKAIRIQKQLALRFPQAGSESGEAWRVYYGNTNADFPLKQDVFLPPKIIDDLEQAALAREVFQTELEKERKAAREAVRVFTGTEGLNRIEKALLDCLNVIPPRGDAGEGRYIEIRNIGYALRSFFGQDKAFEILNRWSPEDDSDINWHGIIYGAARAEGDISYEYVFNVAKKYGWKAPKDLYQFDFEADIPEADVTVCQKYLEGIPSVPQKIIAIVSPTGTGKSYAIQNFLETHDGKKEKSVLVYHRRTLAKQTASRSKGLITLYEDVEDLSKFGGTVAITVDSLHKLDMKTFKGCNVVLDETGSIIRHLLSSSTIKNQKETFDAFYLLLRGAKKIVCLESGLSNSTLEVIKSFSSETESYVLRNTYREDKGTAYFYANKQDVLNIAAEKLSQDKHIAIAVDGGEDTVKKYAKILRDKNPGRKIYEVHAGNSGSFARYLENPDLLKFENVDVLIYSPTMYEGADVSFNDNAYFDVVCLLREHGHINPEGVAQALDRVRDIKDREVHIYCSETTDAGTTSAAIIYNQWQKDMEKCVAYMEPDVRTMRHNFSNLYAPIFQKLAAFVARDNMTGRCVIANLQTLLERKGYQVLEANIKPDEVISREDVREASKKIEAAKTEAILAAEDITEEKAENHKGRTDLTEQEQNEIEKYYLRRLNGDSDDELEYIVQNRKTIRDSVHAVEQLGMTFEGLQKLSNKLNQTKVDASYNPIVDKAFLRQKAFEIIGGWGYTGILDAAKFAEWFKSLSNEARTDLGLKFTDNELKRPQKVLGQFLATMGLKTVSTMGKRKNGRTRHYRLDPYQQKQLQDILTRRKNKKERVDEAAHNRVFVSERILGWE